MKILVIPDLHGRSHWKRIMNRIDEYDKIVFIGDYMDSFTITTIEIKKNLEDIIAFKKKYPDKVVLLIGNHEAHYIMNHLMYNGYRGECKLLMSHLFRTDSDEHKSFPLFQAAFQYKNYLFTHAGVVQEFYDYFMEIIPEYLAENDSPDNYNLAELLNIMMEQDFKNPNYVQSILLTNGTERGGYLPFSSIMWTGRKELIANHIKGYHQIVGHTPLFKIEKVEVNENTSLAFTDVLFDNIEKCPDPMFYEIEID